MERTSYIGQKIKAARKMRGWSLDDLCEELKKHNGVFAEKNVSKQTLSKYERSVILPSGDTLLNIAHVFNLPTGFFLQPFKFTLDDAEYRKKTNLPKKELDKIKATIQDKLERYFEIEEVCGIAQTPITKTKICTEEDVYALAKQIRKQWNLGLDGIVNVIEEIEKYGIKIIDADTDNSFDGMSGNALNSGFMVLNKHFTPERKRFTALHELGHLLMNLENFEHKNAESLCNLFASEMLLPRDVFISLLGEKRHNISLFELRNIQSLFGISVEGLMFKAHKEGIISGQRSKYFLVKKNTDPKFKSDVEKSLLKDEISQRQERLVYQAFNNGIISSSRAAELLNTDINTIRELELV
ncbi:MAG: ImmA/IrrE family metallo-endopeptidase [Bacteroidales bacterium]|nr:ImmA/IrrE family metallo-endopeptidase [Bacteroidales bacterium]